MSLHVPANPGRPRGSNLYFLKVQKPSHCQSWLYFIISKVQCFRNVTVRLGYGT